MKSIALLSDTHNYLDERIFPYLEQCDEIWHAGDIGNLDIIDHLKKFAKTRAVYGNIDNDTIRKELNKILMFKCEEVKVLMTHIGGYPKKYRPDIKDEIKKYKPDIYICGHSHILKIMYDQEYNLLHINPGAAGREGFHKVRTIVLLEIQGKQIKNLQVVELGPRVELTQHIN